MSILLSRRAVFASLVALGLSTTAMAAQPLTTGLGQAWPNTQDLSSSTHWHVYAFTSDGVKYIQVNDLNGNVRGAIAAANGQFLVLPMGRDARRISTPQKVATLSSTVVPLPAHAELVYRDRGISLVAVPVSDGTVLFQASNNNSATRAPCDPDKEDCNTHLTAPMTSSLAAPSCDPDKEDCNTHLTTNTTSTLIAPSCDPDKEDCNTHLSATTVSTLAAPSCDPDKEDCNTHVR
ncbi:hypothetical protein ACFWZU_06745 [Frateuria sp. GZRR33]|uniref:hypothetical protein n=1 Tax=Frateuria sp. GZRR33 TaxID=3351535 RepID=UPI003EDC32F8